MRKLLPVFLLASVLLSGCSSETIKSQAEPTESSEQGEISLDNLIPGLTEQKAFDQTIAYLNSQRAIKAETVFLATENVSAPELQLEKELIGDAARMFQAYLDPENITVVMFTRGDGAWADKKLEELGGDYPTRISTQISNVPSEYYCGFAFATRSDAGDPIYYTCTGSVGEREWPYRQTPPHEYFHLVQYQLTDESMPAWLIEGSAAFFGEVLGYKNLDTPILFRLQQNFNTSYGFDPDREGFDWPRFQSWATDAEVDDVVNLYTKLEASPTMDMERLAYYTLGSWATEALIASFGFEKFMELWIEIERAGSFEEGFRITFGLEPVDFYKKLTPLINSKVDPGLE